MDKLILLGGLAFGLLITYYVLKFTWDAISYSSFSDPDGKRESRRAARRARRAAKRRRRLTRADDGNTSARPANPRTHDVRRDDQKIVSS